MATYYSDLGTGATTFPGFVTHNWGAVCSSSTLSSPVAYNATASKQGMLKDQMKPTTVTGHRFCAGTTPGTNKHKYTGGSAAGWYPLCSLARPTAYTQAMKVAGGSMAVVASTRFAGARFWMDAYDSAGVRQASAGPVAGAIPTTKPGNIVVAFTSSQFVTVPVGGYLVARISCQGSTARLYYGPSGATPALPAGATRTFYWNPTETPVVTGSAVENRERFYDAQGTPLPDGTKVYEYASSTMAYTGVVATIGGAAVGSGAADPLVAAAATGVGEAVFTRNNGDVAEYFYVIPDLGNAAVWTAATPYAVGARINPASESGLIAQVQSIAGTGTSAPVTEPTWPSTVGATVVDNAGINQITWEMVEAETICTNAVKGYQLAAWSATTAQVSGDRVAPAGAGYYASIDSVANEGTTGAVEPTWPAVDLQTVVDGTVTWTMHVRP